MGAVNCPETPRQKMIGMMYLVLTAMLALNVSSSVLDAFTKVQAGLTETVNNYYKMNNVVYAEFDNAYTLNESKVKPWRDKALEVKKQANELAAYIEDLKIEMVKAADGDDGDVNNIVAKDNLDIAGEIMLVYNKADELKDKISSYREFVLSLVCDKNPVLCKSLQENLSTENPPIIGGEMNTWASDNFDQMPLSAVVTILTKMQLDVRNAEAGVVSHLYKNIDEGSFKFNSISAHVLPDSRYILLGERYNAKILLAAVDSTQRPVVQVNGITVNKRAGDAALYSVVCDRVGTFSWKGVVNYLTPTGETKKYFVNDEYIVAAPSVIVSPLKMNVFYLGVENPVDISVSGIAASRTSARVTNGSITKRNDIYYVSPREAGKSCDVTVSIMDKASVKDMHTLKFRVKTVPDPVAMVSNSRGGDISKSLLSASWGVKAELDDFDFDMSFNVLGFNIYTIVDGGYVKEAASNSSRFTAEQKQLISTARRGQRVIIDNITASGPDGRIRKLQPLSFKIN